MKEIEQILDKLRQYMPLLRDKYKVKTLQLFGSYRRGQQKKRSDVDLLVEFEEPLSLFEFLALEGQLSELLGKKVDLAMKTTLKPRIGKHILEEAIPV